MIQGDEQVTIGSILDAAHEIIHADMAKRFADLQKKVQARPGISHKEMITHTLKEMQMLCKALTKEGQSTALGPNSTLNQIENHERFFVEYKCVFQLTSPNSGCKLCCRSCCVIQ